MTSTLSTANAARQSFFLPYFLYKLRKHKAMLIMSLVFNALCVPPFLINGIMIIQSQIESLKKGVEISYGSGPIMTIFIMVVSAHVILFMSIVAPTVIFSYYNKRNDVDMYLSLPLKSGERFWGDFLTGLIVSVGGVLAQLVLCFPLTLILQSQSEQLARLGSISQDAVPTMGYPAMLIICITLAVIVIATVYIISTFVTVSCGKTADSIIYSIICVFIGLIIGGIFLGIIELKSVGLDDSDALQVMYYFPPFGILFKVLPTLINSTPILDSQAPDGLDINTRFYTAYGKAWGELLLYSIIPVLLCTGLLILSFYLNNRRKAEKTGTPFVYSIVYYILSTAVIAVTELIFLMFNEATSTYGASKTALITFSSTTATIFGVGIFVSAIVFFFVELLYKRGFKKLWQMPIKFVGVTIASVLIYFGLAASAKQLSFVTIPVAENVKAVEISIGSTYNKSSIRLTKPEDIELVTNQIHPGAVKGNYEGSSGDTYNSIRYKLKDGTTKYCQIKGMINSENNDALRQLFHQSDFLLDKIERTNAELDFPDFYMYLSSDNLEISLIKREKKEEFLQCYYNDVKKSALKGEVAGIITATGYGNLLPFSNITIFDDFTECKKFLENPDNVVRRGNALYNQMFEDISYDPDTSDANLDINNVKESIWIDLAKPSNLRHQDVQKLLDCIAICDDNFNPVINSYFYRDDDYYTYDGMEVDNICNSIVVDDECYTIDLYYFIFGHVNVKVKEGREQEFVQLYYKLCKNRDALI